MPLVFNPLEFNSSYIDDNNMVGSVIKKDYEAS